MTHASSGETSLRQVKNHRSERPLLCRFLGRLHEADIRARRRQASEKRQGTKSRLVGSGGAAGSMGIWPQEASLGWCIGGPGLGGSDVQRGVGGRLDERK